MARSIRRRTAGHLESVRVPGDAPVIIGAPAKAPVKLQTRLAVECAGLSEVRAVYLFQLAFEEIDDEPHPGVGLVLAADAEFRVVAERLAAALERSVAGGPVDFIPIDDDLLDVVRSHGILIYEST